MFLAFATCICFFFAGKMEEAKKNKLVIEMTNSDAYTVGHALRENIIAHESSRNLKTVFVKTSDTLNIETEGRFVIEMKPNSRKTPQEALNQAIKRLTDELDAIRSELI